MNEMLDVETGYFCTYWAKCRNGRVCPARYDDRARQAERVMWFKQRKKLKKFDELPECMDEVK